MNHTPPMPAQPDDVEPRRRQTDGADLPVHIRKPLFGILMKYSKGAARSKDRKWQYFDLEDSYIETPYFLHKEHGTDQ